MAHIALENRAAPVDALLYGDVPTPLHYRRNHFPYPEVKAGVWSLEISGAVDRRVTWSLAQLKRLPRKELTVLLECAGHRRSEYNPPVPGVEWKLGALSQARWSGTPLREVLARCGARPEAMEVALYATDHGPFSGMESVHYARSLPLAKALHPDTLLAWEMNGEPLPEMHGAPVRAIVPGWYAMDSVKWLAGIEVRTEPFRGPFQEHDYRLWFGEDDGPGIRLAEIPVHALIVAPQDNAIPKAGRLELSGLAWGGSGGIRTVEVRVDEGPWMSAAVKPGVSQYARSTWTAEIDLPRGQHMLAVRATDGAGQTQPDQPVWNRRGYANNSVHRVRVRGT